MKIFLKTFAAGLLAMFICVNLCFSQALSPAAMKLKTAYVQLKIYPGAKPKQLAYLKAFPQNKQQFVEIFAPANNGQLYSSSHEYINTFVGLAQNYPAEVMERSISIGKDMKWEADAIGDMQKGIAELAVQNTKMFSTKVKALPAHDIDNLIKFLADEEGIKNDLQYQHLIDILRKQGHSGLADKFVAARTAREKEKDH